MNGRQWVKVSRELQGQVMDEGDGVWSRRERMKAGAGALLTLNIDVAAVSALLDKAVLNSAVCRHQSS